MPGIWVTANPLVGVAALLWNRWQDSCGISGSFAVEWPAALVWNQWQDSRGIGGSFRVESVAGLPWNRWQLSRGIRTLTSIDRLWTTDAVLTEVLAMFSGAGAYLRQGAARRVRALLSDTHVVLIPATHDLFLDAFSLYERRPDKSYSLTDCMSMQVMRREGLTEVLTNDHHFTQEGFQIVFPSS